MPENNIYVWIDHSVDDDLVSAILYENVKECNYIVENIDDASKKTIVSRGAFDANHMAQYLKKQSDNSYFIAIIKQKLEKRVFISNEFNGIIISLFGEQDYDDIRSIAQLIYISSLLDIDSDISDICRVDDLFDLEIPEDHQLILGRIEYNKIPEPVHAVLTHGIRTHATWAEEAHDVLLKKNIGSSIFRYGFFDIINFAINFRARRNLSEELLNRINSAQQKNPKKKLSIIAHSFGSIVLAKALDLAEKVNNRIEIDAVILNGSILPIKYKWKNFTQPEKNHGVTIKRVLNVCGDGDSLPVIASHTILGAGSSGAFFLNDNHAYNLINIRLKDTNHSDMLSIGHAEDIWCRYMLNSEFEPQSTATNPTKLVTSLHYVLLVLKYLVLFIIIKVIVNKYFPDLLIELDNLIFNCKQEILNIYNLSTSFIEQLFFDR